MKNFIFSFSILFGILFFGAIETQSVVAQTTDTQQVYLAQADHSSADQAASHTVISAEAGEEAHHIAPLWLVIPFAALLLMIATGPLFYEHFWHKNYPKIAVGLALLVVFYYLFILDNVHAPVHAMAEYIQFIALLAALYIASGGILIEIDKKATPMANVTLLIIGALISNLIGTTGASMLLIRPFIRLNKGNVQAYHIIFFIFMVSNVGGSLTPIGDPPLFLGFLKGIPFFWTLEHNWPAWMFALSALAIAFYFIDKKLGRANDDSELEETVYTNKFSMIGIKNFGWLFIIICSVFLDPNVIEGVPAIVYDGQKFSYIREIIMLSVAYLSYRFADTRAIKGNEFNFEPIREVAFIFVGIFGTMMPALELVGTFAKSPEGAAMITHNTLYWGTGILSGFLDNAPTYLNFLAAAMASKGASIGNIEEVRQFAADGYHDSAFELMAIAIASVFFGAMTYIGNGPNFMVKSIAEQNGVKMPSFFGYIIRFSLPILLPLLFLVWLLFFAFVEV
ncbi:Na+/H+ antiporter NhaD/arsenite permease-like protein [Algoriphagus ratkowskyi]|uniref:Citrate transporter n=1 Tax=Algoriphagus ratkowskyi TaxID=57028 RepID=A0A2W7RN65_9BACT|nr:sodium:proton antiporter [Algoriphagus ratkowskyi]PZX59900.1 Na+/H+ antiporter NhaD/arsenite permease-like protein [Algoriphagus ratkowskyi]TXD78397.1 citrate transporter [Algoriphagus ratkowskyi]